MKMLLHLLAVSGSFLAATSHASMDVSLGRGFNGDVGYSGVNGGVEIWTGARVGLENANWEWGFPYPHWNAEAHGWAEGHGVFEMGVLSLREPYAVGELDCVRQDRWGVLEPATLIAGAVLLVPFGISTLRRLRWKRMGRD